MIRLAAVRKWFDVTIKVTLIAATIVAPMIGSRDLGTAGEHCRTAGAKTMSGMPRATVATAAATPLKGDAMSGHDCSHCPPSDCTTSATCSGVVLSAAVGAECAAWPTNDWAGISIATATTALTSNGFPPPTPPPQA